MLIRTYWLVVLFSSSVSLLVYLLMVPSAMRATLTCGCNNWCVWVSSQLCEAVLHVLPLLCSVCVLQQCCVFLMNWPLCYYVVSSLLLFFVLESVLLVLMSCSSSFWLMIIYCTPFIFLLLSCLYDMLEVSFFSIACNSCFLICPASCCVLIDLFRPNIFMYLLTC